MDTGPIFLSGATGFVGRHVLAELLQRGKAVHALVRKKGRLKPHDHLQEFAGSIERAVDVAAAMAGCAATIHLVGIIAEKKGQTFEGVHVRGTRQVVEAAVNAGVKRYVHMSALGTRPAAASRYHQSKWAAEEIVRGSRLDWTIFRPSLIVGQGGEFTKMLRDWALGKTPPYFFMPYFGAGLLGQNNPFEIQPVRVENVAWLFAQALENETSIRQGYEVGGPDRFTWKAFLTQESAAIRDGKPKPALGVPAWLAKAVAALHLPAPFTADQVTMSLEPNTANMTPLLHDFPTLKLQPYHAEPAENA